MADTPLPPCGLYRTTIAHPERTEEVPAGRLIYFHNHSTKGPPLVLLPQSNAQNKWTFSERGFLVQTLSWCRSLVPLSGEGFYTLADDIPVGSGHIPRAALVQLGYNREGEPIVFFPSYDRKSNGLVFPTQGARIDHTSLAALRPLDLRGPIPPEGRS